MSRESSSLNHFKSSRLKFKGDVFSLWENVLFFLCFFSSTKYLLLCVYLGKRGRLSKADLDTGWSKDDERQCSLCQKYGDLKSNVNNSQNIKIEWFTEECKPNSLIFVNSPFSLINFMLDCVVSFLRKQAGYCIWARMNGLMSTAACGLQKFLKRTMALCCMYTALSQGGVWWLVVITLINWKLLKICRVEPDQSLSFYCNYVNPNFILHSSLSLTPIVFSDVNVAISRVPLWAAVWHLVKATTTSCAPAPVSVSSRMIKRSTAINTDISSVAG